MRARWLTPWIVASLAVSGGGCKPVHRSTHSDPTIRLLWEAGDGRLVDEEEMSMGCVRCGERTVGIQKGRLSVDDADYGAVASGDRVMVWQDGKVTVNGQRREPTPVADRH